VDPNAVDLDFVIADVFTEHAFGGNQLAVFPDARGLSAAAMQVLAREFNFAESTFVLPPADPANTARVRIFTPRSELPFAGHPTVGTAAVLASLGRVPTGTAVFELGVGPVPVRIEDHPGRPFCELTLRREPEIPAQRPDHKALAETLGLSTSDIVDGWYASAGLPFCFAHLTSAAAVDRAAFNAAAWRDHLADGWAPDLYLFAGDPAPGTRLYARMFAPSSGIAEDPATGSACAALVGTLAGRWDAPDGTFAMSVDQGVLIKRPALIHASAAKTAGRVHTITVGGSTVLVGTGTMTAPPSQP
jgi:trans-2,3-dihydro-3-hydroxyanthranilate isomerase